MLKKETKRKRKTLKTTEDLLKKQNYTLSQK